MPMLPRGRSAAAMRLSDSSAAPPWYLRVAPGATLPWLVALRWITVIVALTAAAVAWLLPGVDVPLRRLGLLIALTAAANTAVAVSLSRGRPVPRALGALGLGIEMLLLTGLLELTGGPFNPFGLILGAQVMLAALTLGRVYAVAGAALAAACYGVLIFWHVQETGELHHRLNDLPTHALTMWMAIATAGDLVGYFVVQASAALARRERDLEAMRERAARTDRLVSLTTLAAGAAHELSTPLATIAVAARELERTIAGDGRVAGLAEDARLIRTEVDRCQAILDQMSGRAGGTASDDPETVSVASIVDDVRARLPVDQASRLRVTMDDGDALVILPRAGLTQAVLALARNALDASETSGGDVQLEIARHDGRLAVTVRDRGPGMTPAVLERAGEPFFTTKDPGRGLGLGLFLTRVFAERVGGVLTLDSRDGTVARLELPVPARAPEYA